MDEDRAPALAPNEKQLALFRAVEDIHDLTNAVTVLLVDDYGASVAVSGDEEDVPRPIRAVLGGKRLREAGSVVALLSSVGELDASPPKRLIGTRQRADLNVSAFDVDGAHVLAIVFDANADVMTVQDVGKDACGMLAQILAAPL
jgi:hypothetical protein